MAVMPSSALPPPSFGSCGSRCSRPGRPRPGQGARTRTQRCSAHLIPRHFGGWQYLMQGAKCRLSVGLPPLRCAGRTSAQGLTRLSRDQARARAMRVQETLSIPLGAGGPRDGADAEGLALIDGSGSKPGVCRSAECPVEGPIADRAAGKGTTNAIASRRPRFRIAFPPGLNSSSSCSVDQGTWPTPSGRIFNRRPFGSSVST